MIRATTKDAYKLMHQGTLALSQVESNGIRIDQKFLAHALNKTGKLIAAKEKELKNSKEYKVWKKHFGDRLNIDSGQQLGTVLFDLMGHKSTMLTKGGKAKTDITALEELDIPFIKTYLEAKKLKKTRGTYLKGLKREMVNGFIHPNFNLSTARTFRSSSDHPNFQNIPIQDPVMGSWIRPCFIPRKGRVLIEMDYGKLEVCVSACYNHDPVLINYINDKTKDMHRDMAMQLFKIKQQQVNKWTRHAAKNMFVFPQFYGSWYQPCAKGIWESCTTDNLMVHDVPMIKHLRKRGIKRRGRCDEGQKPMPGTFEYHVEKVEDRFWNKRFTAYRDWKHKWIEAYRRTGSFQTLTGFSFEGVFKNNDVINYPIQGSAFHCLLWSLIHALKEIKKQKFKTLLVGQIHDSIVSDTPKSEVDDYLDMMEELMTKTIRKAWKWLIVPLEIEAEVSNTSWHDKKPWIRKNGVWRPEYE